jgi:DnaK suppressor protein
MAQAMYNPGLFFPRQELKMPAKKTASKKRTKATVSRKKVAAKKSTSKKKVKSKSVTRKKVGSKSKSVSKKKVSKKKASKKKGPSSKKASKKKVSKKKVSKKKASKKKAPARKKVTKKSPSKKKAPVKKKATKGKVSKKGTVSAKRSTKKAVSKKGTSAPIRTAKRVPPLKPSPIRHTRSRDALSGPIHGIPPYKPARGEEYMSPKQIEHFRSILTSWKKELMFEVDRTVHHMQDEAANFPDPNDRATQESEFGLELRTRDRERKLLRKIESALSRLDDGSYGYCDETGEEIGLKRLEARPVATLCLEAQERRELSERQYRDRDDRYR